MSTGLLRGLVLYAAFSATGATAAPPNPQPDEQNTIIVSGKRVGEKDVQEYVRALTPIPVGGQLSRFEKSICPVAIGLHPLQREAVANRIRRVAGSVGMRVGGKDCVPNVVVVVTEDKNVFLRELRRTRYEYFGTLSQRKVRELERQPGPAVAWQLQGPPVNARGVELQADPDLGVYVNRTIDPSSRLQSAARPQFDGAVVIVERKALDGLTITQLSDYAAMRAFAGMDVARLAKSGTQTILRVLDAPMGSPVAASLTKSDFGFLRGLYTVPRTLRPDGQRAAIRRSIVKELESDPR